MSDSRWKNHFIRMSKGIRGKCRFYIPANSTNIKVIKKNTHTKRHSKKKTTTQPKLSIVSPAQSSVLRAESMIRKSSKQKNIGTKKSRTGAKMTNRKLLTHVKADGGKKRRNKAWGGRTIWDFQKKKRT